MRVLGIDPGSQITGIGIVDVDGNATRYVFAESLTLPRGALQNRLRKIYQRLEQLIAQYTPDVMALEKVFLAKNPQAALTLGHARGAAMLAGVNADLQIEEYSATEIKKAIVGRGRADKAQVAHMVRVLLNLRQTPPTDAADALACAICHVHHSQTAAALSGRANLVGKVLS